MAQIHAQLYKIRPHTVLVPSKQHSRGFAALSYETKIAQIESSNKWSHSEWKHLRLMVFQKPSICDIQTRLSEASCASHTEWTCDVMDYFCPAAAALSDGERCDPLIWWQLSYQSWHIHADFSWLPPLPLAAHTEQRQQPGIRGPLTHHLGGCVGQPPIQMGFFFFFPTGGSQEERRGRKSH